MEKKMTLVLLILVLIGLVFVACTEEPTLVPTQEQTPAGTNGSSAGDLPEEPEPQTDSRTAEEFGEIIIRGDQLSRDLIFPGFHMYQHEGEERAVPTEWGISLGFRVLPTSGFETIADIRAAFLPYLTEEMVDELLEWGASFYEEYNDNLYFFPYRASDSKWIWAEANFAIIEQDSNRTVIEVIVPGTAEGQQWTETMHYTFLYDRISERKRIQE